MDIASKEVADTGTLELLDAAEEPLLNEEGQRCTITLYSPGTKEYAKAENARNNQLVARVKKKGKGDLSVEEEHRQDAEFLASCTVSVFGFTHKGVVIDSKAKFVDLYLDRGIGFIRAQVKEFLGDWANFTKSSATS